MASEEFSKIEIETLFYESYNTLSEDDILQINKNNPGGDINNVVVGLCPHCFGMCVDQDNKEISYQVFYINGRNKLEGDIMHLSLNSKYRDYLTFYFSNFLAHNYQGLDAIDVYNTFQSQMRSMLEKLGFITIDSSTVAKFQNPTFIAAGARGIIQIDFIDRLSLYRDLFGKSRFELDTEKSDDYVYLMLNKRNNYVKIGKSKKPLFREKTLQSDEPDIELIVAWPGTSVIEKELHRLFLKKRKRGEWFELQLSDIRIIQEYMNRPDSKVS